MMPKELVRSQLASQIVTTLKQMASQAETVKKSAAPLLSTVGIIDIKATASRDGDTIMLALKFVFSDEKEAEEFWSLIKKLLESK